MVIYPAKHLFEAQFPKLEDHEEEILYQHPTWPIQCNQIGVMYYDEDVIAVYEKNGRLSVSYKPTWAFCGTKTRVVWECYHGVVMWSPRFLFGNANPYDLRKENLIMVRGLSRSQADHLGRIKARFTNASVEHLVKLEERMKGMGYTGTQTWELLKIPYWLKVARRAYQGAPLEEGQSRRGGSKSKTTDEEKAEVCSAFKAGWTYPRIVAHMGWRSVTRVKKVVKDAGLTR